MNSTLVIAFAVVLLSFVFTVFKGIGMSSIFNLDAFLIVVGGTTMALFVGFSAERISGTVKEIIRAFSRQRDRDRVIRDIVEVSRMYQKTTIKNIEKKMEHIDDDFLKLGVNLLINDHGRDEIKDIMEREMIMRIMNYSFSQNLLQTAARLTPAFGLAGTVISLIKMFRHFESVDAIAPSMAVAMSSTLYGVIIANLLMLPLCAKLREREILSETLMKITIDGILAIKNMEHSLKIEDKLTGYLKAENNRLEKAAAALAVPGDISAALSK